MNPTLLDQAARDFRRRFGRRPAAAAFAPGRIEVLGNHTDYNDGLVLSAAIGRGTFFLAAPLKGRTCRVYSVQAGEEAAFSASDPRAAKAPWLRYIAGVFDGLVPASERAAGFAACVSGDIPLGAGLSSSAALEMSAALALARLYGQERASLDLARIGQRAEHEFAGVRCGLLDQVSSLFGRRRSLVRLDCRSLNVGAVPLRGEVRFLVCNTRSAHTLASSQYNQRRAECERAVRHFAAALPHPVAALRDVSMAEWRRHRRGLDPVAARRAAHVIAECARVERAAALLPEGRVEEFGELMFDSHRSSRRNFENSSAELDFAVDAARRLPGVLGARLSGGGWGGSVLVLVRSRAASAVSRSLSAAFARQYGAPCTVLPVTPAPGARLVGRTA